jgi:protein TonB
MRRERTNLTPSMMVSVGLHLAVFLSAVIVWPWFGKPVQVANVTAITLTPAPSAPPPPALQAPEEQQAQAPEPTPTPEVKPPPAPPPQPQPTPVPKPPQPQPKPKADRAAADKLLQSLAQTQKTPSKAKSDNFLANLDASLTPQKPQGARRGPAQAETALAPRTDPGAAQATTDAAAAVSGRLNRIWNKSCGVEGFRDLVIRVKFNLTIDGQLLGAPQVMDPAPPGNSVWQAAADRAVRAVNQAAPFSELPRHTYGQWKSFTAIFNGREACQNP